MQFSSSTLFKGQKPQKGSFKELVMETMFPLIQIHKRTEAVIWKIDKCKIGYIVISKSLIIVHETC